ncbi:MAG: PPC domain-containing protein [Anaerolinea sp.]|nr:PPC domain-containing protein [Anaerolinea sp.]
MRLLLALLIVLLVVPFAASARQIDPADGGVIAPGDTEEGRFSTSEPAVAYTLTVEAGQSVVVDLMSDDFDSYLVALDEDGNEIATDDDGGDGLNSRLTLNTPGTYTIVAQSLSYRSSGTAAIGNYVLRVDELTTRPIEYGQSVDGELTNDELTVVYNFRGTEGDVIVAQHFSEDYDSYLTLQFEGMDLVSNDDGAGNLDSRIGPYTLPDSGEYALIVRSLGGTSTGDYEVTLDLVSLITVEYGEPATGTFETADTPLYFQFDGVSGDIIDITVEGKGETTVQLMDAYGYMSTSDYTEAVAHELSNIVLTSEGLYTVVVQSAGGTGSVTVTVAAAELASLNDGAQEISFDSSVFQQTLGFTAERRTTYRITLELTDGDMGSPSIDMRGDGSTVTYASISNITMLSFEFEAETSGAYTLVISDYSYDGTTYMVTLEEVE